MLDLQARKDVMCKFISTRDMCNGDRLVLSRMVTEDISMKPEDQVTLPDKRNQKMEGDGKRFYFLSREFAMSGLHPDWNPPASFKTYLVINCLLSVSLPAEEYISKLVEFLAQHSFLYEGVLC